MATLAPEYSRVRFPDRTEALGIPLRPLTIDHALLLWRIGSPFVASGPVGLGQIVTALYVLSRPCAIAANGLQQRRTDWLLKLWGWQIMARTSPADRYVARSTIEQFIQDSFDGPDLWEAEAASEKKCAAPFLQILKCRLQSCLGISRAEALSYPVREAIWDLACHAEDMGRVEWVSPEQVEFITKVAKN